MTDATWRDVWLNEGFAGYSRTRIMTQFMATDRDHGEVFDLQSLREDLARLKPDDQALLIDLRDRDPALGI